MNKILIVDDSAFTRSIHKNILTEAGYATVEATSGAEAIAAYDAENPDLVLIDLLMPDMDGMDAARDILTGDPRAKIVICSTDKQKARQEEAESIGVLGFLTKPVNADKVKETLNGLLAD